MSLERRNELIAELCEVLDLPDPDSVVAAGQIAGGRL